MERGGRRSGGVLIKKRSSSGCLILKKKTDNNNNNNNLLTSDSEDYNVERDSYYPEDCFFERRRLDDEDESEEDEELLKRSYDGSSGKKSYLGSSAQFGINRECGSSKYLDIERMRIRRPCLDQKSLNLDKPIRVQGKNGVLKVMPNKHNKVMRGLPQSFTHVQAQKPGETGKIRVAIKAETKLVPTARVHSNGLQLPMKSKGHEQDSEDSDDSGRLEKRIIQPQKVLKIEREKTLAEAPTLSKTREGGKVKRGSGTEKQRLRERIREMLLEAGWSIDYRPRRNRDYLDAVYISPRGTAYWSIIKAYEALLKQVNSEEQVAKPCEVGSAATLISDEILSQLTRKTKRKIENDMKRVGQCANDSDGQGSLGDFTAPLDEPLTHVSLDLSG
ncbi:unnamed protein product [Eruca vesicaria subsp. sativa]|uniref:DUF7028 domain-containing protein n=1 Tax=Eruca vesicaria subsp. sativa TaxID=29727 RepID=A0ABC8JG62_ERUVS|nr:unnamed protein product [Eruca vesicaria subsp. sativa]